MNSPIRAAVCHQLAQSASQPSSQSLARTSGLTRCWLTSAKVSNNSNILALTCSGTSSNLGRNHTNEIMLAAALCALLCATWPTTARLHAPFLMKCRCAAWKCASF